MSADNWRYCPKCIKRREAEGNPVNEDKDEDYTLREDYELLMDEEGTFYVKYSCSCSECGFSFKYEYSKSVSLT